MMTEFVQRRRGVRAIALSLTLSLAACLLAFEGKAESGFVGMQVQGMPPEAAAALGLAKAEGVLVRDVAIGGPAAVAGFRRGDLIVKFDGQAIDTFERLIQAVGRTPSGKSVAVTVKRGGRPVDLTLKTDVKPAAWSVEKGAFANITAIGSTVAALTPKIRETFNVPWGTVGVVVTLVDTTKNHGLARGEVIVQVNEQDVWLPDQVVDIVTNAQRAKRKHVLMLVANASGIVYRLVPID